MCKKLTLKNVTSFVYNSAHSEINSIIMYIADGVPIIGYPYRGKYNSCNLHNNYLHLYLQLCKRQTSRKFCKTQHPNSSNGCLLEDWKHIAATLHLGCTNLEPYT